MALINVVKGFLIGIALVVPGLSGSLFAVVVGLYDEILIAISEFRKNIKKNILFLLPILIGVAIGILSSTKLVLYVCEAYMFQSYSFFIGLVLGTVPLAVKKMNVKKFKPGKLAFTVFGFAAILFVSYLSKRLGNREGYIAITEISGINDFMAVFFAGVFSCSLMAIPGVSGSVMLMLIGYYGAVYNSVANLTDMLKYLIKGDMVAVSQSFSSVLIIVPFAIGAVVGIVLIAKVLGYFLEKYESEMYYGVLGLVFGAVVTLFTDGVYNDFMLSISGGATSIVLSILFIIIFAVIGYLSAVFLDRN